MSRMPSKMILPLAVGGGLLLLVLGACGMNAYVDRQLDQAQRHAEAQAAAEWAAITPEQHMAEARTALAKGNLASARKHAEALPADQAGAILEEIRATEATQRKAEREKQKAEQIAHQAAHGDAPNPVVLEIALARALKDVAHDPESVSDVAVSQPVAATLGPVGCWKAKFTFRARNGFGTMRITPGTLWAKDGAIIRTEF